MAIIAVVAVALALLAALLVAAPVNAATVGSTTESGMSADAESYKVAPGETVLIKISNMPSSTGLAEVNFEDADGFTADEYFVVTSTEKDLNATVKIVADAETPLGEYLVTIVPKTNASQAVEVTLTVDRSLSQVISGNLTYLGGGIGLIAVGYVATNVIKNKTAKRITKPLSILMYIGGGAMILWVLYLAVGALF
jgi:hypothetical protein